jgi:hypothetical protein
VREGLIELTQTEPYAPLHVRSASSHRTLHLVADNSAADAAAAEATAALGAGSVGDDGENDGSDHGDEDAAS